MPAVCPKSIESTCRASPFNAMNAMMHIHPKKMTHAVNFTLDMPSTLNCFT